MGNSSNHDWIDETGAIVISGAIPVIAAYLYGGVELLIDALKGLMVTY